ncbi:MAG: lipopolysaccharide biosynthesis, partial [Bryobacterales bacterium]|nr:lipopolysaccharide biosynthesis [Bryobacterales bacterium]
LILLAGIIGAVVVSMSQDRMYESRASIEIQGVNENFLNFQNIDPATPNGSPESFIQTQAEILRQDVLIEQVARKLRIAEQPETSKSPHAVAGSKFPEDLPQNLIETVKKHLKIKSSRDSRIIQIVFVARDPQFTADFANTLAQEFIEQSVEARRRAAQQIQDWLSPQLEALRTKLGKSETALDAYARATGLMFTEGQQNLAQEKLKLLQDELSKAQGDRIAKESWYQLAATNKPESLMDDPAIRDYDAKIADLRRQQADLQSILTPQNYKVIRLKAQIDQLESTRDREVKRIQQRLQNDYKAAEAREQNLAQVYSRQSGLVSSLSDKITHYHTLKHEVDSNRQFYESMVQKVNEAGIASAVRQSNIRLVGPAKPAPEPYKPNVPLNLAIGVFASLTVGAGFVLLQEQADSRLHVPGEAGVYLTLPELGAIQKFQPRTVLPQRLLRSGNGDHGLERITWEQTRSGWSESFRATVASLLSAGCNGDCPRILLVTSSLPREGKTTVASNLAIALAEISKRVLLVDADVRRPRLHKIFGVANDRGFIDLLVRENAFDESPVAPLIKKTAVPHLYVLPSGAYKNNIFSLLQSEGTDRLLRRFRQAFDYVIVDSPPCLHLADARLLARYADGAVLVVRADHAEKKTALAAAQRLMLDGVTVLGTILNGWDPAGRGGTYGYEYSKYETLTDQHPHSSR